MLIYAIKWTYKMPALYGIATVVSYEKTTYQDKRAAMKAAKMLAFGKAATCEVVLIKQSDLKKLVF